MHIKLKTLLLSFYLVLLCPASGSAEIFGPPWTKTTIEGEKIIQLHFFWSKTCPHCKKAKPFVRELAKSYPWLDLDSYEISENPGNARLYRSLSQKIGKENLAVPAFLFCGKALIGYLSKETTGEQLRSELLNCRGSLVQGKSGAEIQTTVNNQFSLPLLGDFTPKDMSLPAFTIIIAGLDAFNPCAFFVLLLMLSLLTNAKDRKKMLIIGGVFVFFSGFMYFLFMAAWLNLFLYLGEIRIITVIAALIAIGVSLINIKDYFFFKRGMSLTIPDGAKPNLYGRIRGLMNASNLPTLILGTAMLAIVANSYELLCTSGFPMVFTRLLTLHELTPLDYYLYLVLYNIIYVIPLIIIVWIFSRTLGARKLSEKEGRILKLLSGLMMLELGLLLLVAPNLLNNLFTAIALITLAILLSSAIVYVDNKFAGAK